MRLPHIAIIIMLGVASIQIAYFAPHLPNVMASHFGASGSPNGWQTKEVFFITFAFVYLLLTGLAWAAPHLILGLPPALVHLPNKAYWLAPERREITAHRVADQMAWFCAAEIGFLILVMQMAINANLPGSSGMLGAGFFWVAGLFLAFAVVWGVRFTRMFRVGRT